MSYGRVRCIGNRQKVKGHNHPIIMSEVEAEQVFKKKINHRVA